MEVRGTLQLLTGMCDRSIQSTYTDAKMEMETKQRFYQLLLDYQCTQEHSSTTEVS